MDAMSERASEREREREREKKTSTSHAPVLGASVLDCLERHCNPLDAAVGHCFPPSAVSAAMLALGRI
jgi:hypothetical protein